MEVVVKSNVLVHVSKSPDDRNLIGIMPHRIAKNYSPGWHLLSGVYWRFRLFCYEDLRGERPGGHSRIIPRTFDGRTRVMPNQVWVEKGTHELWVVVKVSKDSKGKNRVCIRPYVRDGYVNERFDMATNSFTITKELSHSVFINTKRLWDDHVEYVSTLKEAT